MSKIKPLFSFDSALFLVTFLLFVSIFPPQAKAETSDALQILSSMQLGYSKVEDYRATFIREERIKGKLNPPEVIELEFRRPFMVKMDWKEGPKRGRSVVFVRGENENKMIVRLNGFFGRFLHFLLLDPEGTMAREGSRHPITQAGIGNLVDSLIKLTQKAEKEGDLDLRLLGEEVIGKRKAYLLERKLPAKKYESPRTLIYIDKELLLPIQILRFDANGELFERYAYENLKINRDISSTVFNLQNPYKRKPNEEKVIVKQVREVVQQAQKSYEALNDYSALFHKTERLNNDTISDEIYEMKFLKPSYLYFQIKQGKFKGSEIFYRPVKDGAEKMVVRPGGVMGNLLSAVNMDTFSLPIDMEMIKKNNRHLVQEMGIGYFLNRYAKDFETGITAGDIFVSLFPKVINGEEGREIELILKDQRKRDKYYAPRTLVFFSNRTKLPINIKVFDERGELLEHYRYNDLKIDGGLTPAVFDPQTLKLSPPAPQPSPTPAVPATSLSN